MTMRIEGQYTDKERIVASAVWHATTLHRRTITADAVETLSTAVAEALAGPNPRLTALAAATDWTANIIDPYAVRRDTLQLVTLLNSIDEGTAK